MAKFCFTVHERFDQTTEGDRSCPPCVFLHLAM